jgi:hypothetical protein
MTVPNIPTVKRGGHRYYVHPETNDAVPGVTSIIGMLPKGFLKFWAAKLVAETAVENFGTLASMIASGDQVGAIDYLKRAPMRNTGEAADTGSAVHDLVERIARGEDLGPVHPELQPFVDHFRTFVQDFSPEFLFLEETVWNETHGYAGSFDWIARIGDAVVIGDNKTTRSGVYPETALQLTAYARAEYILHADGTKTDLPPIEAAAVLHLRPEGYKLIPVFMTDEAFDTFLGLRRTLDWDREHSKHALGKPLPAPSKDGAA